MALIASIPPEPSSPAWRKLAYLVVSVVFAAALIWFLVHENKGFSVSRLAQTLSSMHPGWLAAGAISSLAAYLVRAMRWRVLIGPYGSQASVVDILGNTFIGFAAVMVLGRPAELVRPYLIARQVRSPFSTQAGAWLLERIYDLLAILALTAWTLLTLQPGEVPAGSPIAIGIRAGGAIVLTASIAALVLLGAFTFAADAAAARLRDALGFLPEDRKHKVFRFLDPFLDAISVSRDPSRLRVIVLYTLLHWVLVAAGVWLIFLSAPASAALGPAQAVRFLALLAVASAIPIPSMAGGYFFISALLLTEWLRLSLEAATGVTTAIWIAQLGFCIPLGVLAALRSGLNWRKIKNMEREAHL